MLFLKSHAEMTTLSPSNECTDIVTLPDTPMNNRISSIEITAPAGSRECFTAALDAGADAVYAGADGFNLRAGSERFSATEIGEMTAIAHDRGRKFLLAANVLVFDDDYDLLARTLDSAADSGVDAVILWDPAALTMARERGLRIHLSTQASVANSRAALSYADQDVKRIVPARELSLGQLAAMIRAVREAGSDMEFEVFVHGAMCLAVSGRCLASQFLWGRSANRGDCTQPCRWPFRVIDERAGMEMEVRGSTLLSARDLCTIDIADRIAAAGVGAWKIEGRMRDAHYVSTTVSCYREARDAVADGTFGPELAASLRERLERVFHRGFSHGFYLGNPDRDYALGEETHATVVRRFAGRVANYYPKAGAADVRLEAGGIAVGDTLVVLGPTTGCREFILESLRSEDNSDITHAKRGDLVGIAVPVKVRMNDRVYVLEPNTNRPFDVHPL